MKHTWVIALSALLLSTSVIAQAPQPAPQQLEPTLGSYSRPNSPSFNTRASIGAAFDPDAFWTSLAIEMQLDKFIAIGPTLQVGFSDITNYVLGSVGPRFVLPYRSMEFFTGAGVGLSYRDQTGIQFTNFLVEYQIGAEYYFLENLSVGVAARMNFISSRALEDIPVIMGSISGHF